MLLVAFGYRELNNAMPDAGTSFTWASRAFGPWIGWMGGWGIIAADIIVMANLAQIAGSYSFRLVGLDELADDQLWGSCLVLGMEDQGRPERGRSRRRGD